MSGPPASSRLRDVALGAAVGVVGVVAFFAAQKRRRRLALPRPRREEVRPRRSDEAPAASQQLAPVQFEAADDAARLARRIETVLRRRTQRVIVVLERLCDGHNYSAIFRTCEALGIQHVWMVAPPQERFESAQCVKRKWKRDKLAELEANIAKTAKPAAATKPGSRREQKFARSLRTWDDDIALDEAHASFGRGAARFLTFREFESSEECLAALRAVEDLKVWTTDLGQEAVVLAAGAPWLEAEGLPEQLALVIGTESTGVSNLFHDAADKRVYLPLNGFADSLNVGVATALALQTILQLYGKDACGDLIDPPAKAPRIYTAETAKPGVLRAAWARYLSRDEKQHAAVVASLESEVPLLDDLRRAEAFREHNGRNLANDKSAKHQARLAANAALNKVC